MAAPNTAPLTGRRLRQTGNSRTWRSPFAAGTSSARTGASAIDTMERQHSKMINVTNPSLYYRRMDGTPSEPLNAATFHQIARSLNDIIIDLQGIDIANVDKSERLD